MGRPPSVGLIVNARASRVRSHYLPRDRFWRRLLPPERVWLTQSPGDLERVIALTQKCGVDRVAILGGDGTFQVTLSTIIRLWRERFPTIIPLPGGTMNALCSNLGVCRSPEAALAAALVGLEKYGSESRVRVAQKSLIKVSESSERYGFTFANGVVFHAFADYYRTVSPGVADALRAVLTAFVSGMLPAASQSNRLRPIQAEVRSHGKLLVEGPVRVVTASTLDNPVLWIRPFPRELNGFRRFHCLVNAMATRDLLRKAWPLMRGTTGDPHHFVDQLDELEITTDQGYILDGEIYELPGETTIRITLGPVLQFLVAAR